MLPKGRHIKRAWLWSRDCFKILPFALMRQLSYLLALCVCVVIKNFRNLILKRDRFSKKNNNFSNMFNFLRVQAAITPQ